MRLDEIKALGCSHFRVRATALRPETRILIDGVLVDAALERQRADSKGRVAHHHKYDLMCCIVRGEGAMAEIERMTITLPAEMAAAVRGAVEGGDYASSSEVVREALRDWKAKRALQLQELASLQADIDRGLADLASGRVRDFDAERIIARGRQLLAGRSRSA